MPIYEYAPTSGHCDKCKGLFEVTQRVADAKLSTDGRFTLLTRGDDTPIKRKAQPGDRHLVLPSAPAFLGCTVVTATVDPPKAAAQ